MRLGQRILLVLAEWKRSEAHANRSHDMSRRQIRHALVTIVTFATWLPTASPRASGQCNPEQLEKLVGSSTGERFGTSCAISGDHAVCGAPFADPGGYQDAGTFSVYRRFNNDWQLLADPWIGLAGANLGWSVAISGDTLVVGMPGADAPGVDEGEVAVFRIAAGGVFFVDLLTGSTTGAGDRFGSSVAIHNNVMVVGAPRNDTQGADSGSVYVFERSPSGWVEVDVLAPAELDAGDQFGSAVSAYGIGIVVGAPYYEEPSTFPVVPTDGGKVFGFRRRASGWVPWSWGGSISPSPAEKAYFGGSVDLGAGTQVVGALGHPTQIFPPLPELPGHVYVWDRNVLAADLDGAFWSYQFGASVAIDGGDLLVAAPGSSESVYAYRRVGSSWVFADQVVGADTTSGDRFGASCDLVDGTVFVGANGDDDAGTDSGSAYFFDLDGVTNADPCLADGTAKLAGGATFGVATTGPSPQSFVWRRDGVPLVDGGHVSGASTGTLSISPCGIDDEGDYEAVVSNACGSAVVGPASLAVVCGEVEQFEELWAATPGSGDNFATSVDLDGPYVVAPAGWDDNAKGIDAGSVSVFEQTPSGWIETVLTQPGGDADDRFGYDASISGDLLLVGAGGDELVYGVNNAGSAWVFKKSGSGWTYETGLNASDYAANHYYGRQVDLDGDVAAVAAHTASQVAINAGAVYVHRRHADPTVLWKQEALLHALDAAANDFLGSSVSNSCDRLVAGAEGRDEPGRVDTGAAYVFRHVGGGSWIQEAKLLASDGAAYDWFGHSVAIAGDTLVVGAPRHNGSRGAAYVFRRTSLLGWTQEKKLTASDGADADRFGERVTIDGDVIVVGSWWDDDLGAESGSAYVFTRQGGTWPLMQKVHAADGAAGDRFGVGVAVRGSRAVVSAYLHDAHGGPIDAGAAYVYDLGGERPASYCTAKTNSLGCVPAIGSNGTPSVSNFEPFLVTATNVLNNKTGYVFYGLNGAATIPFQGGTKCVAAPTRRTPNQLSGGNASGDDCSGGYSFDFNALVASGANPALIEGVDVWTQYWMRDPQSASTTGLTDGLHFVLFH